MIEPKKKKPIAKRGRPPGQARFTERLQVAVDAAMLERLRAYARARDVDFAKAAREVCEAGLKKKGF